MGENVAEVNPARELHPSALEFSHTPSQLDHSHFSNETHLPQTTHFIAPTLSPNTAPITDGPPVPTVSAMGTDQDVATGNDTHPNSTRGAEGRLGVPKPRGRAPRDPLGQTIRYDVQSLEELEETLRNYLEHPLVPAEHATIEFAFPISSAFMVYNKAPREQYAEPIHKAYGKTAISVMEALRPTVDPKEQLEKQRRIAKVCVEAVMNADGFRYQFHNNWLSKEDEAQRFSYYCNDSPLNKGRAANEGAGSEGKRRRKETYECQGVLHIKFSATKSNLEVHYRHIPLHKTYAERAPPPRKDSKRMKLLQVFNPELIPTKKEKQIKSMPVPNSPDSSKMPDDRNRDGSKGADDQTGTTEEDLQPLTDHRDNGRVVHNGPSNAAGGEVSADVSLLPLPTDKLGEVRKKQITKRPSIPGTMQGNLIQGDLVWNADRKILKRPHKQKKPPPEPTSEVEILKAKLLEAERRIQSLESERNGQPNKCPPQPSPYQYTPPYPPPQLQSCLPQPGYWPQHPPPNSATHPVMGPPFITSSTNSTAHYRPNSSTSPTSGLTEPSHTVPTTSSAASPTSQSDFHPSQPIQFEPGAGTVAVAQLRTKTQHHAVAQVQLPIQSEAWARSQAPPMVMSVTLSQKDEEKERVRQLWIERQREHQIRKQKGRPDEEPVLLGVKAGPATEGDGGTDGEPEQTGVVRRESLPDGNGRPDGAVGETSNEIQEATEGAQGRETRGLPPNRVGEEEARHTNTSGKDDESARTEGTGEQPSIDERPERMTGVQAEREKGSKQASAEEEGSELAWTSGDGISAAEDAGAEA